MNKKETVICEFEMDFKKSVCWRSLRIQIEWDEINARKFVAARILFLSVAHVAVAIVLPIMSKERWVFIPLKHWKLKQY